MYINKQDLGKELNMKEFKNVNHNVITLIFNSKEAVLNYFEEDDLNTYTILTKSGSTIAKNVDKKSLDTVKKCFVYEYDNCNEKIFIVFCNSCIDYYGDFNNDKKEWLYVSDELLRKIKNICNILNKDIDIVRLYDYADETEDILNKIKTESIIKHVDLDIEYSIDPEEHPEIDYDILKEKILKYLPDYKFDIKNGIYTEQYVWMKNVTREDSEYFINTFKDFDDLEMYTRIYYNIKDIEL